jgi:hypothetical protein
MHCIILLSFPGNEIGDTAHNAPVFDSDRLDALADFWRDWSAEVRARHALVSKVARKFGKLPRSFRDTVIAHERGHQLHYARQWTN